MGDARNNMYMYQTVAKTANIPEHWTYVESNKFIIPFSICVQTFLIHVDLQVHDCMSDTLFIYIHVDVAKNASGYHNQDFTAKMVIEEKATETPSL